MWNTTKYQIQQQALTKKYNEDILKKKELYLIKHYEDVGDIQQLSNLGIIGITGNNIDLVSIYKIVFIIIIISTILL